MVLDEAGRVASVAPRPRLDSHRLIEEFMVLANVAALTISGCGGPCQAEPDRSSGGVRSTSRARSESRLARSSALTSSG